MSLINNLLKDIERRDTRQHSVLPFIALKPKKQFTFTLSSQTKVFLLTSLSCLVLGMGILGLMHSSSKKLMPILPDDLIKSSNEAEAMPTLPTVAISAITLQIKQNVTELTFLLSHTTLYRVISHDHLNQLTIVVDHSQLQSALPTINSLHTAIERITAQTIGNDTYITLFLHPATQLKYLNSNDDDKNAQLIVGLVNGVEPKEETIANDAPRQTTSVSSASLVKIPDADSLLLQQYQEALSAVENGDYNSALQQLETLIAADPHYKDARVSLAALLLDQGYLLKSKETIADGLRLNPDYAPLMELKARIMTQEGKVTQALTYLQLNPPALAQNPEYHALIAALYEKTDQYLPAFKLYKQLLAMDSSNANWWMGLGISLEKLGQSKSAVSAYAKALQEGKLDGTSVSYLQDRLQILRGNDNEKG